MANQEFKKWADALWPIAGMILGLIAMPVAIAQYPIFFNENKWILPTSVVVVLACWVIPLFKHARAKHLYRLAFSFGMIGRTIAIILVASAIAVAGLGFKKLFRFHERHLAEALYKTEPPSTGANPRATEETNKIAAPTPPLGAPKQMRHHNPRAVTKHPYDLSGDRENKLTELLSKPLTETRLLLRVGCISWSEYACVAAGRFLIVFSKAGWTIQENRVFRLEPAVPVDGVTIASIPEAGPALPPHLGRWHKASQSEMALITAFRQMNIPVRVSGDTALSAGIVGVYFGPEPQP